jgi:monothiol glutaredoxin
MIANGIIAPNDAEPDAPIDSACTDAQHAAMAAGQVGQIRILG